MFQDLVHRRPLVSKKCNLRVSLSWRIVAPSVVVVIVVVGGGDGTIAKEEE